jgi:hypothetical protein
MRSINDSTISRIPLVGMKVSNNRKRGANNGIYQAKYDIISLFRSEPIAAIGKIKDTEKSEIKHKENLLQ